MGSRPWLVLMVLMAVAIGTQLVRENRLLKHRLLLQQQFIKALPQQDCPKPKALNGELI